MDTKEIEIVEKALTKAHKFLPGMTEGEIIVKQGEAFGSLDSDTDIKADSLIGEVITQVLAKEGACGRITVEGRHDDVVIHSHGDEKWYCVDPLDGSLNYRLRGDTLGLPFSSCITVLDCSFDAAFSNVIAAGVIDLRSGDLWLSSKDKRGKYWTTLNGEPSFTMQAKTLDIGSMIVIGEMYYPENRELLAKIFAGQKGWLRNPGSAAYEMALVSSGQIAAYICDRQKQHELGAAYALVKGAGGVAVDFEGRDIERLPYDFVSQNQIILAANSSIAEQILEKI